MLKDHPTRTLGIAVAQLGGINLDDTRQSVVNRLIEMLKEAHGRGANLIVFPELALTTFFPRYWMDENEAQARFFEQSMPNPSVQPLFDEARKRKIAFYLGYAELTPEGTPYNSAILVNEKGEIVGKYRKIHLPGHDDHKMDAPFQHLEKKFFQVGDKTFGVWEAMGANIGMCLCNDRRWSETWRVMALQNAEVIVLGYNTPSQNIHWPEPVHLRMHHHLITLQASAYQNSVWAAAAAKCGSEDGHHMIGGSVIVAPTGEIVAQASTEEDEVITVKADLALADVFRKNVFNFENHRRPEFYGLITRRTGRGRPL
ncbi:MAG TPA: N-carbamoyl-D-amino-acid hydrolase [Advenella kashmirensis]|uniref:N-carbamoyl-D-amino-acid hydrolase n=1 Tax=Advenella kashmirensis TaxID=310575 RepID=A0A356LHD9_9BURK|nr:N-carbamoyl-D-amino-acid hydrolase [Advenella kashmirensis]